MWLLNSNWVTEKLLVIEFSQANHLEQNTTVLDLAKICTKEEKETNTLRILKPRAILPYIATRSTGSKTLDLIERNKPIFKLETSPEYARMMSEVGRSCPKGGNSASSPSSDSSPSDPPQATKMAKTSTATPSSSSPVPSDKTATNNNEDDDFINKVCKFEMISRKKTSSTSSSPKSPTTSIGKSPTSSKLFLTTDGLAGGVWKGGGGGRGSGGSIGSAGGGSGGGGGSSPMVCPSPPVFVGEKVFTRDTATTRVSASLLQNLASPSELVAAAQARGASTGAKTATNSDEYNTRAQSEVSSNNSRSTHSSGSSSLTSVSALSVTSDRSDKSKLFGNRQTSGPGVDRAGPKTDIMSSSDPCVFPSKTLTNESSCVQGEEEEDNGPIYDDVPTPVPSPRVLPAHAASAAASAKHRGGVFDLTPDSSPSPSSSRKHKSVGAQPVSPLQHPQYQRVDSTGSSRSGTPTRDSQPKKFVTLSVSSDRDSFPTPLIKQLSEDKGDKPFPFITPVSSSPSPSDPPLSSLASFSSAEQSNGNNSPVNSMLSPYSNTNGSNNRDSIRSSSSAGSAGTGKGSEGVPGNAAHKVAGLRLSPSRSSPSPSLTSSSTSSSHRNTFEGMDFDFGELTSQQQQLALRHREVVAERKKEQEREKQDRQRLEDILKMCEEYQQEVESNHGTPTSASASFSLPIPATSASVFPSSPEHVNGYTAENVNSSRTPTSGATFGFPLVGYTGDQTHPEQSPQHQDQFAYYATHTSPYNGSHDHTQHQHQQQQPNQPRPEVVTSVSPPAVKPTHIDLTSLSSTSSPTSSMERKNKIKTNGSLMLGSPNNPYKEFSPPFSFNQASASTPSISFSTTNPTDSSALTVPAAQIKPVDTSSTAYSSNSEDENVGTSEDTGTIKKRPGMMLPGHGAKAADGDAPPIPKRHPLHHHHDHGAPGGPTPPSSRSDQPPPPPPKSPRVWNIRHDAPPPPPPSSSSPSSHESSTSGGGSLRVVPPTASITMTADISEDNTVTVTTTKDFPDREYNINSSNRSPYSSAAAEAILSSSSPSSSYSSSSITTTTTTTVTTTISSTSTMPTYTSDHRSHHHNHHHHYHQQHAPAKLNHQSSTSSSSSSSSHTIVRANNCSSPVAMDTRASGRKEDSPTPVNSDTEQGEVNVPPPAPLSPRMLSGPDLSPLMSVVTTVTSPKAGLTAKEECQMRGQLEGLRLSRTQLLVNTAELKRQMAEIEIQEGEAVRELDLETKLLEGEHRDQMALLQQEQERLEAMKRRQSEALDMALREREKEQRIIQLERQKLLALEEQHHALNERLLRGRSASPSGQDGGPPRSPRSPVSPNGSTASVFTTGSATCTTPTNRNSSGSVGSGGGLHVPEDGEELLARRVRLQQELERQRRIFDDLEFQQLEAEARFESEREQINNRLLAQQSALLQKYKEREERLQQIDVQQKEMVTSVKSNLEKFKTQRTEMAEAYKGEKAKIAHCDKKIADLSRMLSLPIPMQREDSDEDLEDLQASQHAPSPRSGDQRFIVDDLDDAFMSAATSDLGRSLDFSLDSSTGEDGTSGSGQQRKKSTTLLEIERNRSLFIEQQGSHIIDQERKRIEELRRRAADEGRAQWEERRRTADQTEERLAREANCKSFNSVESEDSSIASSCETPSEKETSLSGGEEHLEKLAELEKLLAQAQSEKIKLVEEQVRIRESEMLALQKNEVLERELQEVRLREKNSQIQQARPMTRFLPNTSRDFDLRAHVEGAGHQLDACPHVIITSHSCRGWLQKMGGRIKTWKKRWFLFDRIKRKVFYFTDKSEVKLKGSVCFQAIEEVYADHLKTVKSPSPKLTFCMKTFDRTYFLVAPSPESMTIWIDVLFSGAEGYQQFYDS